MKKKWRAGEREGGRVGSWYGWGREEFGEEGEREEERGRESRVIGEIKTGGER